MGLSIIISAIITIPISLLLAFFIRNVFIYNLVVAITFLVLTVLSKLFLDWYINKDKKNYNEYFEILEQFKKDSSSQNEHIMGILTLIITLASVLIFGNFRFLLVFGVLLSLIFFGSYNLSKNAEGEHLLTPLPLHPLPELSDGAEKKTEKRTYQWFYNESLLNGSAKTPYTMTVHINLDTLQCAREKPRIKLYSDTDVSKWVVYPEAITDEVKEAASQIRKISTEKGFYAIEEITNALSFVQQSIPYSYDEDTSPTHEVDYPRYPIETLYDSTGDCECKTFLACSLLLELGYDVAYFSAVGHIALGVSVKHSMPGYFVPFSNGKRYYYYETTAKGWRFGEVPKDVKITGLYPLKFNPTHDLSNCVKQHKKGSDGA